MKDNIREATFNLVGGWTPEKYAFDLFAGTGALGLEALSRGAVHAVFIERHIPTARTIRENIATLRAESETTVITSDTFFWFRQLLKAPGGLPENPWIVFCSPPYQLYKESREPLLEMLDHLIALSPATSVFAVESDPDFPHSALPHADRWKVRTYSPAQICIFHK